MSSTPPILRLRHYAGYIALCCIWGTTWLAIRVVVRDVPPLYAAAMRFMIAAAILGVGILAGRLGLPRKGKDWGGIGILGATMMAIPYGLLFWAEQSVTSSMTALLFSSLPLWVALFTPLMTGSVVPRRVIASMVVASGGMLTILYAGISTTPKALLGGAAVLLAVVFSAWSSIFAKTRIHHLPAAVSTATQLVAGGLMLFAASLLMEHGRTAHWNRNSLMALLFLATFGSAAAFAIYYWLLKEMAPYQLATISLIVPVVAMAEGALILHEPIPLMMRLAAAVVLCAVGFALRAQPVEEIALNLSVDSKL